MRARTGAIAALAVGAGVIAVWALPLTGRAPPPAKVTVQRVRSAGDRVYLAPAQLLQADSTGAAGRTVTSVLNVPHRMRFGEFVWDDLGVSKGPVWVRVDLPSQLISVFRAGNEIGTAVIVYGATEKQSPQGIFPILAKYKDHRSATYDAAMPYTLRLTSDGISIHGSNVRWGRATHGCIGVPTPFAKLLFDQVNVGDDVVIVGDREVGPAPENNAA